MNPTARWPRLPSAVRKRAATSRAAPSLFAIAVIATAVAAATGASAQQSASSTGEFTPRAKQVILMDAESGGILYRHNADQLAAPASMSKLMTLAIAFKLLKAGKIKMSDEFAISVNAWRKGGAPSGGTAMMIPVHLKIRLEELLQGIIVQNGNDASIAVAEGIAGSEDNFTKLMTEEARRLGMPKSQFRNPTGLYHPEHLMTVTELAILARHLMREYPDYFPMFAQREFKFRRHTFKNRNPLLFTDPNVFNVDGMKTGYVNHAGYGIVITARISNRRVIAVVHGANSSNDRSEEIRRLLDWGSKSITSFKLFDGTEEIGRARVWGGSTFSVPLVGGSDINVWMSRFPAGQRLRGEIVYASPLKAPVRKGDEVARLRVTSSNGSMQEVPLYAADDVPEGGLFRRGLDSLAHLAGRLIPRLDSFTRVEAQK